MIAANSLGIEIVKACWDSNDKSQRNCPLTTHEDRQTPPQQLTTPEARQTPSQQLTTPEACQTPPRQRLHR